MAFISNIFMYKMAFTYQIKFLLYKKRYLIFIYQKHKYLENEIRYIEEPRTPFLLIS